MDNEYENLLRIKILPELEVGRPNWDRPHTEAVVEHIKAIIDNNPELNLDKVVLVIAAYAHDWGYAGLFKAGKPLNIDGVNNAKVSHMKMGVEKVKKLLSDEVFNFLTENQKLRVQHLVQVHDDLKNIRDVDEIVLMEADTLGGLDVEKVKPSFDKESNAKYMEGIKNTRYPMFITEYGKHMFNKLFQSRQDFYTNIS